MSQEHSNSPAKPHRTGSASARAGLRALQERLVTDEKIMAQAQISPYIYWHAVAIFIIALLVALFIAVELGAILAVAAVASAIYAILRKEVLMLVVTDRRIFARYGILQVDVVDIHFDKIESVELERMLPGYLMGYSNVILMGTGNRFIVIPYVANGPHLRRVYNELTLAGAPPTPPGALRAAQEG